MLGSGDEAITYRKAELKTFVALGVEDKLADDELSLLGSVLEFSEKEVSAIMVSPRMYVVSVELMIDPYRGYVLPIGREDCGTYHPEVRS
jgi:metal transporter CNNM